MQHTEYHLLPTTPLAAASSMIQEGVSSYSAEKALRTAERQRELATLALDAVNRICHDTNFGKQRKQNFETPFARVSPGHFLLHRTGIRSLPPSSTTPLKSADSGSKFTPKKLATPSCSLEMMLRSSGKNRTSRLGLMHSPDAAVCVSPLPRVTPSAQRVAAAPSSNASRTLNALQRRHSQLLEDCEAAERAVVLAAEQRQLYNAEAQTAACRSKELQTAIAQYERQIEDLKSQHTECASQMKEMSLLLDDRQAQAAKARNSLESIRAQSAAASDELAAIKEEVHSAHAQKESLCRHIEELRVSEREAQSLQMALASLQSQVAESTSHLAEIVQQQEAAEEALAAAEARREAAETAATQFAEASKVHQDAAATASALAIEAEALLEEKEARATMAQRDWEAHETRLATASTELVEVSARLEARRALLEETEGRLASALTSIERDGVAAQQAGASRAELESELLAVQLRLDDARTDELAAIERCIIEEARAGKAAERANAEEMRGRELRRVAERLEEQCFAVQQAEQLLQKLKSEISGLETSVHLRSQVEKLEQVNGQLQQALTDLQASSTTSPLGDLAVGRELQEREAELMNRVEDIKHLDLIEERCRRTEHALHAALREVDRLTHHHHSIQEVHCLQAELDQVKFEYSNAVSEAQEAKLRAESAERQVADADSRVRLAIGERDAVSDKVAVLAEARESSIREISEVRKELAHRQSMLEELREHVSHMGHVIKLLKQEKMDVGNLAAALQLKVGSLEEQLKAEMSRRVVRQTMVKGLGSIGTLRTTGSKLEAGEVHVLAAQNSVLKATATKLSKALAVSLRGKMDNKTQRTSGSEEGLIAAVHAHGRKRDECGMPGSGEEEGQYLEQVLEHLRAVESLSSK